MISGASDLVHHWKGTLLSPGRLTTALQPINVQLPRESIPRLRAVH